MPVHAVTGYLRFQKAVPGTGLVATIWGKGAAVKQGWQGMEWKQVLRQNGITLKALLETLVGNRG